MAGLVLIVLLVGAAVAPRLGTDSRPGFTGHPDWRNRWS
ncbi:MAG: hypothetical protein QOH53_1747 [Ilumatobacteraceae bacterium]